MVRRIEAVYENGVLRPLEPLALEERQRVEVTIRDRAELKSRVEHVVSIDRQAEMKWIGDHQDEYRGQWLALWGDQLISHGLDARAVFDEAHRKGIERPFMHHVPPDPDLPSAGLLLL
jgi:predicted DNA-binding antitoxin AbrB/MazE fold protein